MKWRILFKNRKHIDIDQNVSEKEAREIAKSARPKWDEPTVAMIDPPPAVRHCQGCGQFMPIDCVLKYCPECGNQPDWKSYKGPPNFVPNR